MPAIRAARPDDHDGAIQLWRDAAMGTMTEEEWQTVIASPTSVLLVAEDAGRVVGAGIAAFDGWRAYIYHVAVAPAYRGQGLAKTLMGEAEGLLAQAGAHRVFAMVHEDNPSGLALATVMGYELEGDVVGVKELDEPGTAP